MFSQYSANAAADRKPARVAQLQEEGGGSAGSVDPQDASPPVGYYGSASSTHLNNSVGSRHGSYSILNPENSFVIPSQLHRESSSHFYQRLHQGSMISVSPSPQETLSRVENLQEMRPFRLIGVSIPPCNWALFRRSEEWVSSLRNKGLQQYYARQQALIERYAEIDRMLDSGFQFHMLREYGNDIGEDNVSVPGSAKRQGAPANIDGNTPLLGAGVSKEAQSALVMFAIYVNMAVNVILLCGKIIVTLLTNSLSVMASLIDSVLDFMSTAIIWFSTRLVSVHDWRTKHLYPVGRSRLEPIGVLVFSVLIIVAFLQVLNEALRRLIWGEHVAVVISWAPIAIMATTVVVKVFCWLWCRNIESSAVEALAQDAMTDIVFNTFSIIVPLIGHQLNVWWLDPFGALFLSCYIIYSWGETALEHIDNLTGATASLEDRQVLLYLCSRFAESILQITALNAYHTGDRLTVEVDIVLDAKSSLRDSHDIGEALQYALETLPFVERAFVHLDYRTGNFAGHLS